MSSQQEEKETVASEYTVKHTGSANDFDDPVEMSQCYCGAEREEFDMDNDGEKWICHQCWKLQTSRTVFACHDCPNCKNLFGDSYPIVCGKCNANKHDSFANAVDGDNQSISKLINIVLNKIG